MFHVPFVTMEASNTRDLEGREAIEKMQALAKAQTTCLFATRLGTVPLHVRPMSTQVVDDSGALWFFSSRHSEKNKAIEEGSEVQLFYSNPSSAEFLTVYGSCSVITDKGRIHELWTPLVKAWFPGGKDDPALSLLHVSPHEAHYWDTKNMNAISFLKIVAAAVIGQESDSDAVQGDLHLP